MTSGAQPRKETRAGPLNPRVLLELLAAAAAVAAFLIFVGGAVMWLRFDALALPAERAVALLPEGFLLAVGAQHLAVPALAGVLALVLILTVAQLGERFWEGVAAAGLVVAVYAGALLWLETGLGNLAVASLALGAGAAVAGLLFAWFRGNPYRANRTRRLIGLMVALAAGMMVVFRSAFDLDLVPHLLIVAGVALLSTLAVAATVRGGRGARPLGWAVLVSFLVTGTALVLARTENAPKLEPVALLLEDPEEQVAGFLIGETDDRVHVARLPGVTAGQVEVSAEPVESLVSVARARVVGLALRQPSGLGLADPGRERAQSLLEDLLAQQRAAGGEELPTPEPVTTDDPAATFAPVLSLHPTEPISPTSVDHFLERSWLLWSHAADCTNFSFALDRHASPDERRRPGSVSPRRLGNGGYFHREGCGHDGGRFDSNDFTRPFAGDRDGLPGKEGFYLDLRDRFRAPKPQALDQNQQLVLRSVPVYHERHADEGGERITYWFFYPFSVPPGGGASVGHEGDWERVSVLLRRDGDDRWVPISARYHHHDAHEDVPWADVRKAPNENGQLTRPRGFVARGSHATYRRPGRFPQVLERVGRRIVTVHDDARACPRCPLWLTWQSLVDATDEPWYGFGGAWGQVGKEGSFTGPLGPSVFKTRGLSPAPERQVAQLEATAAGTAPEP